MSETGCDLFLDIHADEELPYPFLDPTSGIPGWSKRLEKLTEIFGEALKKSCPDFMCYTADPRYSYAPDGPDNADLRHLYPRPNPDPNPNPNPKPNPKPKPNPSRRF